MTDRRETLPPFKVGSTAFECWTVDNGQRFEWRSTCGRLAVGAHERRFEDVPGTDPVQRRDASTYFASVDGKRIGTAYPSLIRAMLDATMIRGRRAA